MKILLTALNAKYIHSNLAVHNLKACTSHLGDSVKVMEFTINHQLDDILTELYKEKADVIAFSCYIWNISMILELAALVHQVAPHIQLWLGGPEVSYDAPQVLEKNPFITGIMVGEGETTFRELAEYYVQTSENSEALQLIKGVCYRTAARGQEGLSNCDRSAADGSSGSQNRAQIMQTAPRPLTDMDSIPFAYSDLSIFENRIIYYESSRGCPFSCSYCLSSIDKQVRFRNTEQVKKELKFLLDAGVRQVKFVDRTFNCKHSHAMEIWRFIHENDNGKTNFHFEISADLLNDRELELLARLRPGLVQFEIGIQSTNLKTVEAIDRTMDLDQLAGNIRKLQSFENIHLHMDLIAGLPYEDLESFEQSFNDVYALEPEQLQLGFLKVLKGSKMYERQKDYDLVCHPKPVYEVLSTRWVSFDDIILLKAVEEMVEVYYNTNQFRHALAFLVHFFPSPYQMFKALASFYEERNYHKISHTRMSRYDILREFVVDRNIDDGQAFGQVLLYDLYLRENLKSRPAWARIEEGDKKQINQIYHMEEFIRDALPDYSDYTLRQISRMTHIEIFTIDLLWAEKTGQVVPKQQYILFDYQQRNPLTYEGRTCEVIICAKKKKNG